MKILINYANDAYRKSQQWNTWTGKHIAGFDKVYSFSPKDIDKRYYEAHKDILSEKRGNGLWLWKPYFINRVLNESNEGDIIFYADSGAFFLQNIDVLISSIRNDEKIWVSDNPLLESCFTKKVCLKKMDCDTPEIRDSNQIQATYLMVICCDESKRFIKEWLKWCENYELLSPEGGLSLSDNKGSGFVAHREDQSILSLLCKKHGIVPHKDPSQRGKYPETFYNPNYIFRVPNHPNDKYDSVIFLHKSKAFNLWIFLKWWLIVMKSKINYKIREKTL
mgnify:CR=1 FL=1